MENTQNQAPSEPVHPVSLTKTSHKSGKALFLVVIVLLLAVTGGVYVWQHQKLESSQTSLKTTQSSLDSANKKVSELTAAQKLSEIPTNEVGDCGSDKSNTVLASLNSAPIDGYTAYMEYCLNLPASPETVVFYKIAIDGSRTFAGGTGTAEAKCIPGKIFGANVAQDISKATKLPICKTS